MSATNKLTPLRDRFCQEYILDFDGAGAYCRTVGRTPKSAKGSAHELLQLPCVQAKIKELLEARSARVAIEGDQIIRRFWLIATADPNELVEFRRTCCRHCHGENHEYQLTERELAKLEADWAKRKNAKPTDLFDSLGGSGYDARKTPAPDCPECFGAGVGQAFLKDTRKLSEAARALYAGVKQTKDGLEVKMNNQVESLVNVGKLLGLYVERSADASKLTLEQILSASHTVQTPTPTAPAVTP